MYAIIKTGGKQYKVAEGDVIDVELLGKEAGSAVSFSDVLFVTDGKEHQVGAPHVSGFNVQGEILGESAGPKIASVKYTPRKRNKRKFGHRQHYSRVKITKIAKG
ncbi:MAG: 50S ribosomal protein L21 [Chlamydiales bacterium]|nr:50S ribosomal protein L21 [Chlamydiia bacterium]MCP5507770.1 50S ribosomal protein L21 [Chlamydiales bacterium]